MRNDVPEQNATSEGEVGPRQKSQSAVKGSWRAALKASWQPIFQFNRSSITAFQAIRGAIGVALPLVVGIVVLGQVTGGVVTASGALSLGSVGLNYPYRLRVRAMLLACLFVTLSALAGGITGGIGWLSIPVIGVWGVVAGLFASLSQAALAVGLQACVAFIVYANLKLDPSHALLIAGLVGLGALFQTLLAIVPSPWKNTVPERAALATIYEKLADYAAHPHDEKEILQVSDALLTGRTTLLDSGIRGGKGRMLARLLAEAERLRLTLSLLIRQRQHLSEGGQENARVGRYLDRYIHQSAVELNELAQVLKPSPPFVGPDQAGLESRIARSCEEIKRTLVELRRVVQASGKQDEMQHLLQYCTALLGELHLTRKLATSWRDARQPWATSLRFPYQRPPRLYLEDTWSNLRANLSPQSGALRHAIRLGCALVLATILDRFIPQLGGRGYWIPMTTVLILRSDFITTFTRGIARLLGTLLGAVLATLLAIFLAPSPVLLLIVFIIAVYLMYSLLFANYTIFSVAVTVAVVFLLAFTKAPTLAIAAERAISTVIGGVLALLVYALWPTWERSQLPESIAQRFEKLGGYFNSVMQAYADPAVSQQSVLLGKRHMASRLARSNALGSLQRAQQEPGTYRSDLDLAESILGASDNMARSVLALEAYQLDNPRHDTLPEIADFSHTIEQALQQLAAAIRATLPLPDPPDVRASLQKLQVAAWARKHSHNETRVQWQLVAEEAKQIVANLQVVQQLLAAGSFV